MVPGKITADCGVRGLRLEDAALQAGRGLKPLPAEVFEMQASNKKGSLRANGTAFILFSGPQDWGDMSYLIAIPTRYIRTVKKNKDHLVSTWIPKVWNIMAQCLE